MAKTFEKDRLPPSHPFSYETIMKDPKKMPQVEHNGLTHEILHTGGFVKLYTLKGRLYWTTQANHGMNMPDWKIHFAIARPDVPLAWDVIAKLFMESKCEFGMKVRWQSLIPPTQEAGASHQQASKGSSQGDDHQHNHHLPGNEADPQNTQVPTQAAGEKEGGEGDRDGPSLPQEAPRFAWSEEMWGREITVYCFTYRDVYQGDSVPLESGKMLELKKVDQKSRTFWKEFVRRAEKRLARNGVREIPLNPGDAPFGKRYASLRNEAFIPVDPSWGENVQVHQGETDIYPPNFVGYNAAKHYDWLSSKTRKKNQKKQ